MLFKLPKTLQSLNSTYYYYLIFLDHNIVRILSHMVNQAADQLNHFLSGFELYISLISLYLMSVFGYSTI